MANRASLSPWFLDTAATIYENGECLLYPKTILIDNTSASPATVVFKSGTTSSAAYSGSSLAAIGDNSITVGSKIGPVKGMLFTKGAFSEYVIEQVEDTLFFAADSSSVTSGSWTIANVTYFSVEAQPDTQLTIDVSGTSPWRGLRVEGISSTVTATIFLGPESEVEHAGYGKYPAQAIKIG